MKKTTEKAIKAHAEEEYPKESCGLIIVFKGKEKYVPCRNRSKGLENFVLHPEDYAKAEELGQVIGIVHSHPDETNLPSQADLVSCEATELPWHIVHVNSDTGEPVAGDIRSFEPRGYKAPLVGRVFTHGVLDCYALIRDWYSQEQGIILPEFDRPDQWWDDGHSDLYREGYAKAGFSRVCVGAPERSDQLQVGDGILMQIRSGNGVPNHAGVYIGDSRIIHHLYGRLSSVDIYGGYYRETTTEVLRRL